MEDDLLSKTYTEALKATPSTTTSLEEQRIENAAKREQQEERRRGISTRGARGSTRGSFSNKSVRFSSPPIQPKTSNMSNPSTAPVADPFSSTSVTAPFGGSNTNAATTFNPFTTPRNPFGATSLSVIAGSAQNPFGGPSISPSSSASSPFGAPHAVGRSEAKSVFGAPAGSKPAIGSISFGSPSTATGMQATSIFGASTGMSSAVKANPFGTPDPSLPSTSIFGAPSASAFPTSAASPNPFGTPAPRKLVSSSPGTLTPSTGNGPPQKAHISLKRTNKPTNAGSQNSRPLSTAKDISTFPAIAIASSEKSKLAVEIENLLRQKGILAPAWPTSAPGDPRQKAAIEAFWHTTKAYRAKVRTCLMRNGYLDDPDKPKKLSEAIDFKGTCEEMCPEFEKITRIMEHDVQGPEKELQSDGHTLWPSLPKMVKALARSAAGQDSPLPEDVRSPAALRRTLDYLIDIVLGDNILESVHGFLWNRTRAIRRDFVFQQSSMSSQELVDQVYCLEIITRFHVIALHQMSEEGNTAEDFSEQQEVEQLGKALLSLVHAYEDCQVQGISCENEGEFRAYYVIFNSQNTGILEAVQDWGYKVWVESDNIRTAVSLVECLQNIWDTTGPLRPHSSTDIAQNAFHRFFVILEDSKVSYTMACFAEIHFNTVRKAALKTILAGYRKQRDQTKDWSLTKLNEYLFFDEEDDIIPFGEAYGLNFEVYDGDDCLAFESDDSMMDPFPKLKQCHSKRLVERKRGYNTLPQAIRQTVYEDPLQVLDEEDGMFVPLSESHPDTPKSAFKINFVDPQDEQPVEKSSFAWPATLGSSAASVANSISEDQNKLPPTQLAPPQSSPAAPLDSPLFSFYSPQKQDTHESTVQPSAQSGTRSSTSSSSSAFSFLGQNQNAPQNGLQPPTPSLFASKEDIKKTIDLEAPPALPAPSSSLQSLGVNSPSSSIELNGTSPFSTPKSSVSLSNTSSTASLFQLPGQNREISASKTLAGSAPGSSTTFPKASSPSLFSTEAQTNPQKVSTNTSPIVDILKQIPKAAPMKAPVVINPPWKPLGSFPEWVMLCKRGLIEQFTEFTVEKLLTEAVNQFLAEEAERKDRIDCITADDFRRRSLATKYGDLWRKNAHLLWLRRKGREARELRRQMAQESHRKSVAALSQNVVEDFKKSQRASQRKKTAKNLLPGSGILNGAHIHNEGRKTVRDPRKLINGESSPKTSRPKKSISATSPRPSSHRRIQSEDVRRSIMRDGLTLPGGSFITRSPNWSPEAEDNRARQISGVKTDYFRLKARGIYTLPDGTPLAKTAAVHLMTHKRSFDSISNYTTPDDAEEDNQVLTRIPSIILAKLKATPRPQPVVQEGEDVEVIKARAREIMARDKEKRQNKKKRVLDDSEEELFAKAKRIREQMDEGADWYRAEIERSLSRSSSR